MIESCKIYYCHHLIFELKNDLLKVGDGKHLLAYIDIDNIKDNNNCYISESGLGTTKTCQPKNLIEEYIGNYLAENLDIAGCCDSLSKVLDYVYSQKYGVHKLEMDSEVTYPYIDDGVIMIMNSPIKLNNTTDNQDLVSINGEFILYFMSTI